MGEDLRHPLTRRQLAARRLSSLSAERWLGLASVNRLLNSVQDAPERYTVVANLMKAEMEQWEQEDLGDIARRMHEIEDRLEIARGGPKTQQKQKEVLALLDKKIKQLEDQC